MAGKKKLVLAHYMRHANWSHVKVAYDVTAEIDGERFDRRDEAHLTSPAVMKAAKALEDAVLAELGAELSPMALHAVKKK